MSTILHPADLKRVCNMAHARTRAGERYGLSLSNADLDELAIKIARSDSTTVTLCADRDHANRAWVACHIDGRWLPAVFDRATASIITWLPAHTIDRWRSHLESLIPSEGSPKPAVPFVPYVIFRPEPPPIPKTCADAVARRRALAAENSRLNGSLRNRHRVEWNQDEIRRLKRATHKAQARAQITTMELGDNPDALQLLRAAEAAIRTLKRRIGYDSDVTDDIQAVQNAIRVHLRDNEPMLPGDFEERDTGRATA